MKKLGIIIMILMVVSLFVNAQTIPLVKEKKIKQSEVPVLVLKSFERDFAQMGGLDLDGTWTVSFIMTTDFNGNEMAKPQRYTFELKSKAIREEVVASYFPDGRVEDVEGLSEARSVLGNKQ